MLLLKWLISNMKSIVLELREKVGDYFEIVGSFLFICTCRQIMIFS